MQNRYVADIGDYIKFSILRKFACDRKLGVAWWLFPHKEENADGGHREYLQRQDEWKRYDPDLFEALSKINAKGNLNVSAIEKARILPKAKFASEVVPCGEMPFFTRPEKRNIWLKNIRTKLTDCNLVFVDPDNGIAPEGLRLTRRKAGKSVTIAEIKELAQSHRATVVYHHQSRRLGGHHSEIYALATRLRNHGLSVSGALRANPWSPRVFFILNADKEIQNRAKSVSECWNGRISWHNSDELLRNSN